MKNHFPSNLRFVKRKTCSRKKQILLKTDKAEQQLKGKPDSIL